MEWTSGFSKWFPANCPVLSWLCFLLGPLKKVSMVTSLFGSSEEANDGSPYFYQNHPTRHPAKIIRGNIFTDLLAVV